MFYLIKHLFNFVNYIKMNITDKHIKILEEAEILFAKNGYDGTTVRDIAKAANINLAMISYYFGSKEKLIEMLFKQRMGHIKLRIEAVVNNPKISPFNKIEILIDQYIQRVFEKQAFYKIMFSEQIQNKNRLILNSIKSYKNEFIALIDEVLKEGQKARVFKKNIDTMILLTTMTGTVMQMVINKDAYKLYQQMDKIKNAEYEEILKLKLSTHIRIFSKLH